MEEICAAREQMRETSFCHQTGHRIVNVIFSFVSSFLFVYYLYLVSVVLMFPDYVFFTSLAKNSLLLFLFFYYYCFKFFICTHLDFSVILTYKKYFIKIRIVVILFGARIIKSKIRTLLDRNEN